MTQASSDQNDPSFADREVFISHRNTEASLRFAHLLCTRLTEAGVTAWLDKDRLKAGISYKREITEAIRKARAVVCLFEPEKSDWLIFEAGCAFFDHKLIPVSLRGAEVPAPYSNIQAVDMPTEDEEDFEVQLNSLVEMCKARVQGVETSGYFLRVAQAVNAFFRRGFFALYIVLSAVVTFLLAIFLGDGATIDTSLDDALHHSHAVLGMVTLGGGFFIPIFLARAQASPSYRERRFGTKVAVELFVIWLIIALLGPIIGTLMTARSDSFGLLEDPWISLSVILYVVALFLWVVGLLMVQSSVSADDDQDARRFTIMSARANVAFLAAFSFNVLVVNLMLFHDDFTSLLSGD